jgi:F-box and WD-40 domain protein 1/11
MWLILLCANSVYCLEFDSKILITGSRDKTIKIWHLQTHKLIETKTGHDGSVLCLKFDSRTGFMVSGSSDR